ncbi:hypothetical protein N7520_002927 [Penicillium odoratum]|uniref:uncharacterized protein n=1 Tax=Penicillium odoratum TaxID=1167516 RepID=UPI0025480F23|nr:uncharacterized protein N7520_002927 [Penicillium odoratum]KAJ5772398.1 hypothetical protein N7520_002927 [Penicillium odoratum]
MSFSRDPPPAMSLSQDTQGIFSEFEDPERQDLVHRVLINVGVIEADFVEEIPRANLFLLWFAAKETLEEWAKPASDTVILVLRKQLNEAPLDIPAFLVFSKKNPFTEIRSKKRKFSQPSEEHQQSSPTTSTMSSDPRSNLDATSMECLSVDHSANLQPAIPFPTTSSLPKRDQTIVAQSLGRDKNRCLVTAQGSLFLQSAHIVPHRFSGTVVRSGHTPFWNHLTIYWGRAQCKKWEAELLQGDVINTEFTANMMSLSQHAHSYWGSARFAFRPVSINEDRTEMQIALHWLPILPTSIKRTDLVLPTENPFKNPDAHTRFLPSNNEGLYHWLRQEEIQSGELFTVVTDNPAERPLPSWDLLTLMWHLTRLAAMQGAGEEEEDEEGRPDDDTAPISMGNRADRKENRRVSRGRSPAIPHHSENLSPASAQFTMRLRSQEKSISPLRQLSPGLEIPKRQRLHHSRSRSPMLEE